MKINKPIYEKCISLGWFCGVASSMNRYGLRGHSGPFDWCFSDLQSVLKMMETHFSDFMIKENLSVETDNHKVFYDNKYGFWCNHDIQRDFEEEYNDIYQKYMQRAKRFMEDIKHPTIFIRAVRSEEEILFIEENKDYVYRIIKNENPNNEIAFLILNGMKKLSDNFLCFQLGVEGYIGKTYEMRMLFDSSSDFSAYCKKHILSKENIIQNKEFDKEHNQLKVGKGVLGHSLDESSDDVVLVLRDYFLNLARKGIYLWGVGKYGTRMLPYLIKKGVIVKGIIDNAADKMENGSQNILITIASDTIATEVQKQILDRYPNTRILKFNSLCDQLFEKQGYCD